MYNKDSIFHLPIWPYYLVSLKYNQGMQDEYLILSFYLLSCRIIIWCSINLQNWPMQFWKNIIVNLQIKKNDLF